MKKALITGASSGIGAATAKLLASEKYDLILLGRDQTRLEAMASECSKFGVQVQIVKADLSKTDFLNSLKSIDFKGLSLLVNNAGVYHSKSFSETNLNDWTSDFQTNFFSAVQLTQFLWPILKESGSSHVVNVSSTLGTTPIANTSVYSASKAAMINWNMNLAQEGSAINLRANCVAPGLVDTPIHSFHTLAQNEKSKIEDSIKGQQLVNHIGKPEDIARAILFLEKSPFITGTTINIDGGINLK